MISPDRQSYWLSLITDELLKRKLVFYQDRDKVIRAGWKAMQSFKRQHDEIEHKVINKIHSLKRNVTEHSSEWTVLYWNYYEEELSRSHMG